MRPGQEAPDDHRFDGGHVQALAASMRPGQEAPDDQVPLGFETGRPKLQ